MKNTLRTLSLALIGGLLASSSLFAAGTSTANATLQVTVASEAVFTTIALGTTNLNNASVGNFAGTFQGSTGFNYKVRTGAAAAGTVTLRLTDFTGMSAGTLPIANGFLTFTATTATSGVTIATGDSAFTTAALSAAQTFITFANDTHSASAGDAGSIAWVLADDPSYITGTWTATAQFVISVT